MTVYLSRKGLQYSATNIHNRAVTMDILLHIKQGLHSCNIMCERIAWTEYKLYELAS